ncbi:hypothetical protein M758_5G109500 [Ceratodon purpureus]|nr:hypothetical protein M758_5G109500 [Ceratodon purpureus]
MELHPTVLVFSFFTFLLDTHIIHTRLVSQHPVKCTKSITTQDILGPFTEQNIKNIEQTTNLT